MMMFSKSLNACAKKSFPYRSSFNTLFHTDHQMMQNGFTLLEVIVTILIFTAGFMAIVQALSTSLIAGVDAENTAIAMTLAQQRMEEIKNLDFDTGIVNESKADVSGFTGFQRQVTVAEPQTDLKQVTVETYWIAKGGEVTTSLTTYVSRN